MADKVKELSDEQIDSIDQRLAELRDTVLSTRPADRIATELRLKKFYGLNGFEKPVVIWCDSPWQMAALAFVLQIINRSGRVKSGKRWLKSLLNEFWFRPVWDKYEEFEEYFDPLVRTPRETALLDSPESKALNEFLEWAMFKQRHYVDNDINKQVTAEVRESIESKVQALFRDTLWTAIERPLEADIQMRLLMAGERVAESLRSGNRTQELSQIDSDTVKVFKRLRDTAGNADSGTESTVSGASVYGAHKRSGISWKLMERAIIIPPIERKNNFYAHIFVNSNLPTEVVRIASYINWPWHDATPLVHRLFCELLGSRVEHLEKTFNIELWFEHMKGCLAILPLGNVCLACDRPAKLEVDQWNQLHSTTGPAIEFPDEYRVYAWHGHVVESWFVTEPERITLSDIDSERNTARRRILIEIFGEGRYLEEAGAVVQDESEFGVLFRKELADDEDLVMVKVMNFTAEPDGTHKSYFLRVPPTIETAKDAVAWTFFLQVTSTSQSMKVSWDYHPKRNLS